MLYGQKNEPMTRSLMCFGFECGDGWYDLIRKLSVKLEAWNEKNSNDDRPPIEACQVKSKFGTLRFYVDNCPEEMHKAINAAENKSAKTCEQCGKLGKERGGGWIRTLCEECSEAMERDRAEAAKKFSSKNKNKEESAT